MPVWPQPAIGRKRAGERPCERRRTRLRLALSWRTMMLDAAAQALSQMFSPPFRAVLVKSIGLALILLVIIGIASYHLLGWLAGAGEGLAENALGPNAHGPLAILAFVLTIAASFGVVVREYSERAARRYRPVAEARALRKQHHGTVFMAGLFIAAFVSIPIVNLATPLFGMAFMVHMHKRLAGQQPQLIRAAARDLPR